MSVVLGTYVPTHIYIYAMYVWQDLHMRKKALLPILLWPTNPIESYLYITICMKQIYFIFPIYPWFVRGYIITEEERTHINIKNTYHNGITVYIYINKCEYVLYLKFRKIKTKLCKKYFMCMCVCVCTYLEKTEVDIISWQHKLLCLCCPNERNILINI